MKRLAALAAGIALAAIFRNQASALVMFAVVIGVFVTSVFNITGPSS